MRFTGSSLLSATLALSAAQTGLAAPLPQDTNGLTSLLSNIPVVGTFLGGAGAATGSTSSASSANTTAAGASGNPLATLQEHLPAPGSGVDGILSSGQILGDHLKYTANPPSALEPIPAAQNSPPRELHRQAHAALVPASEKPKSS
ncbi:hypothetical protein J3459_013581 [Metarhizium acridum]|uniref:Uncharacterized protein n=1 Tax=Metarhizium acridum (strain CQMa 102) TaxID=655827 RepID=E9EHQ2_METAQ|nr:uncharacterized protein MAC_09400 [Metarhizium acridum CQMa 102]EFY84554.1 hypothetical protein MAC_09400 [Metarhizium acridum CQMa 102]KAG8412820.1 hypothetical protein J3458_013256 [Metarhizium acridum]KAG8416859.1 hypothetical protein J3459_013581 [Metarhizium acridum]